MFADDSDDSDDTAELIAQSTATTTTKKKAPPAESKKAAAAAAAAKQDDDSDDDDDDDDDAGLFDSDSEDEEVAAAAKKRKTLQHTAAPKPLSKRERLEALAKQRQRKDAVGDDDDDDVVVSGGVVDSVPTRQKNKDDSAKKGDGYESEDTYDSGDFQRTKEDDDFLDTTGEDAEAVQELYAEQRFDDERPVGPKKKKRRYRDDEAIEDDGDVEPDNPIMAAVHRMKRKKRQKKSFTEVEDQCKEFLGRMEMAAENDEQAVSERRPALEKLSMLNEVVDTLTRRDMQRMLLDLDLLIVCRRWIQPLPNGTLGNVTVRQKLLTAIGNMTGENGISANDLKRSELGKTVMVLYKHRAETPAMKRQLKALIEQWSRPIFQKSGNMRDLERVHASRGEGGLAALSRQRVLQTAQSAQKSATNDQDLDSLIASGKQKSGGESGINRVRVPFSKGFSYSVRPSARDDSNSDRRMARPGTSTKDTRGKLSKRMVAKGRKVSKNQRSANISIEGRPTK